MKKFFKDFQEKYVGNNEKGSIIAPSDESVELGSYGTHKSISIGNASMMNDATGSSSQQLHGIMQPVKLKN